MGINSSKLNDCNSNLKKCNEDNVSLTKKNASLNAAVQSGIQNRLAQIKTEMEDIYQQVSALGSRPTVGIKEWDKLASDLDMKIHVLDKENSELTRIQKSSELRIKNVNHNSPKKKLTHYGAFGGSKRPTKLRKTRKKHR